MFESIEANPSLTASHQDEVMHKNVESKQQSNRMLYAGMIAKMNCMLNKLNKFTGSVMTSPIMTQNSEAKVEEYGTGRLLTLKANTSSEHTLPITSDLTKHEIKYVENTSSEFLVNGTKRLIMISPSSEAPVFHRKHSESPAQFLIHVQEYVKSVRLYDRLTLVNGISQFLRESALEWYCQLRLSYRQPQTWEEFTELFLAQFNTPIRRARQETEWEQKPNETETDLVKHLLCRIRNDLFNMIRISRNASLDEIIAEIQQVEDILYRRAKDEQLSNQLEQLSLQKIETLPNRRYNKCDSHKTTPRLIRTIIELMANENYYQTMYSQYVGPIDIAIKSICKNHTFSELYEIAALCNVLQCNIRSIYPKIDFQHYTALWQSVFTTVPPVIAKYSIAILWSHAQNENDARIMNNSTWSPNHFVPLLSLNSQNESNDYYNSMLIYSAVQIRIPEYQSSPSRRVRIDDSIEKDPAEPIISGSVQNRKTDQENQRQIQLEKKRQRNRSSRMSETEEQRQIRLEKARERNRSIRMNDTE
ncbi:unnamed protein product [Rotaria sp. Silwood2]|nr:unnamed protein product [Rotaria sp. Silwood2]